MLPVVWGQAAMPTKHLRRPVYIRFYSLFTQEIQRLLGRNRYDVAGQATALAAELQNLGEEESDSWACEGSDNKWWT